MGVNDIHVGGEGDVILLEVANKGPLEPWQVTPLGEQSEVADLFSDVAERELQWVGRHQHSVAYSFKSPGTQNEFSLTNISKMIADFSEPDLCQMVSKMEALQKHLKEFET